MSRPPTVLGVAGVYVSARGLRGRRAAGLSLVLLLSANPCVFAAVSLSLATNVLATALIAYQAWKHRRLVKAQFAAAGTRSQVLQVLALLVESGSIYCVIMAFSVVTDVVPLPSTDTTGVGLYTVSAYITRGCVIPLAAVYPAVIIVLVALQRSPIDTGGLSSVVQARARAQHAHGGSEPGRGQPGVDVGVEDADGGMSGASDTDTSVALPSRPMLHRDDLKEDAAVDSGITSASLREGRRTSSLRLSEPWMAMLELPMFLGDG
ncbi:hypothetical protein GSI_00007 [Ganoderma sinense ZZ0214-1]|uniref:Uncharacterized protein n=1 Tax=Ganoderma sinense ZZ0214-1 TaxID=1077348 RepID=A0A2G8SRC6_9APHY|nr:hypothetical protein GSI_00007 [Ganoderma sinense ZZ0214-1]